MLARWRVASRCRGQEIMERHAFSAAHFTTLDRKWSVITVSQLGKTAPDAFVVVVNDQDQHALWQAGLDVPSGWQRASAVMSAGECLAVIAGSWLDMTPASVRAGRVRAVAVAVAGGGGAGAGA